MATTFTPLNTDFATQYAQIQADKAKQDRNQQLAQAMMQTGYVPNSGWVGALAPILGAFMGKRLQRQGDEKVSDLLKREFELQGKQTEAKRKQDLADEARKTAAEIEKQRQVDLNRYGAEAANRATPDWKDPAYAQAQAAIAAAKARAEAQYRAPPEILQRIETARKLGASPEELRAIATGQQGAAPPSGYQRTAEGLSYIPGGPADPNRPQPKQPMAAETKNKVALIDSALANAKKYAERVLEKDASGKVTGFKDVASMTDDTPQLIRAAVQDMLYAKSGASAPDKEVDKWVNIYSPSRMLGVPLEKDSTAAAKIGNFLEDLQRLRSESIDPQAAQGTPAQPGQPTREEIMAELARRQRGG